jgi:hypothetical protein
MGSNALRAILLLTVLSVAANAANAPKPVFVHAQCGEQPASALSSLKDELRKSQKYQLIPTLDDYGRMDVVLTIEMTCKGRSDVTAIATAYGKGKCFSSSKCHGAFDSSSLRVDFCDLKDDPTACGRALYEAFDEYVSRPNSVQLNIQ